MTDELAFEACYSDFKLVRTRKVAQFIFEVPVERANIALTVLGGMPNTAAEVWCGIARLDLKRIKEELDKAGEDPPRQHNPYLISAGQLARNKEFWDYAKVTTEEDAAQFIREQCNVMSRRSILPGSVAATYFDQLESKFIDWRENVLRS